MSVRKYFTEEERRAAARACSAKHRRAHPETCREAAHRYYLDHKEEYKARARRHYHDHKEECKENLRGWRKRNPNKYAAHKAKFALNRRKHNLFVISCVVIDALAAGGGETKQQSGT